MKENNFDRNHKIDQDNLFQFPTISPLAPKICACGCENEFQPKRKDQVYLNKQHADFGYNNGKRKKKTVITKQERILRNNDVILDDIWNRLSNGKNEVLCNYELMNLFDFNDAYFIGINNQNDNPIYFTYRYAYTIFFDEKIKYLKIIKR